MNASLVIKRCILSSNDTNRSKVNQTISVYRSKSKHFNIITKITERDDRIIIKRNITWFDSMTNQHRRKTELQTFSCNDERCDELEDMYCSNTSSVLDDTDDQDEIEFMYFT